MQKELGIDNGELSDWYQKEYVTEELQKSVTGDLKGEDYKSSEAFDKALTESFVLRTVENPDGIDNVKTIMKAFSKYIGTGSAGSDKAYRAVMGNYYSSYSELKAAFDNANKNDGGSGGGGTGGGSSGGSRPSKDKDDISSLPGGVGIVGNENNKPEEIPVDIFEDLDSVSWAKDAIVSLAEQGIISGRGDRIFAPNDNITREEFVKIIVSAFAAEENSDGDDFFDVDKNAWYAPYVYTAKNAGIVSGIEENVFGVGMLVTRQDMAVMIYRAAENTGISLPAGEGNSFTDSAEIAEYALEAINALTVVGVINGIDSAHFAPRGFATRAQAAKMVYEILEL